MQNTLMWGLAAAVVAGLYLARGFIAERIHAKVLTVCLVATLGLSGFLVIHAHQLSAEYARRTLPEVLKSMELAAWQLAAYDLPPDPRVEGSDLANFEESLSLIREAGIVLRTYKGAPYAAHARKVPEGMYSLFADLSQFKGASWWDYWERTHGKERIELFFNQETGKLAKAIAALKPFVSEDLWFKPPQPWDLQQDSILYKQELAGGIVVLHTIPNLPGVHVSYLLEDLHGWWSKSGHRFDLDFATHEPLSWESQSWRRRTWGAAEDDRLSMNVGVMRDGRIVAVRVRTADGKEAPATGYFEVGGHRLWFTLHAPDEQPVTQIFGISSTGEVIEELRQK